MTFELEQILESKRALRRKLASCSVAEKLALLEVLRDRTIEIRRATTHAVFTGDVTRKLDSGSKNA